MSEQSPVVFEPLPTLGSRPVQSGDLAATLEVVYLQETLTALGSTHRCAIDVGAHRGDVTDALTELGFRVLAVEPQPLMAERLQKRFSPLIDLKLVQIERCAASNRRDVASLIIGSASTVNTLETSWTEIAFPEEFQNAHRIDVPLQPLADMMRASGFTSPAFVKIDVEGHELPALTGLFAQDSSGHRLSAPPVVMFEANQRFPDAARDCIRLLVQQGYTRFDLFIRDGIAPIAATRFAAPLPDAEALPAEWFSCGDKYFYANVIAYHESLPPELLAADPKEFLQGYHLHAARDVLRQGLSLETGRSTMVHPIWTEARDALRDYLLRDDWREFLKHPVCKNMFYRGRWGAAQDRELAALTASDAGRGLLRRVRDPQFGGPRFSPQSPMLSTNMLGMLYYLMRIENADHARCEAGKSAADSFIEIGGGYGAFAWLYASENPSASYTIIDLPEMLAIQHYYLSLAMPGHCIRFVSRAADAVAQPGEIVLLPSSLLNDSVGGSGVALGESLRCDRLFSTFGFSEFPRELQRRIEQTDYFQARRILLAGQLSTEMPDLRLVAHSEVVGAAMQRFEHLSVERFHIGNNYLLIGNRAA